MKFTDGMRFNPGGEFRIDTRADGLYVVGRGLLISVSDRAEGEQLIEQLKAIGNEPCPCCGRSLPRDQWCINE